MLAKRSLLAFAAIVGIGTFVSGGRPQSPAAQSYQPAIAALEQFIAREVAEKNLPAVSIALVDDQTVVWSKGFGVSDLKTKAPANAETVYRVGSVSKLFTDVAVMQLVEHGKLDLDAPVTNYLPDFKPKNPFEKPITLRQLMSHRAGLVREPPVGHYFDRSAPLLEKTVASLNETAVLIPPEQRIKYSNAGIAVVGQVIAATQKQPFADFLKNQVLIPLGMKKSSFEPTPEVMRDLASAFMWTYHGREFPAPKFELGMAPAGCMYSTVVDLAKFLSMVFANGKTPAGQVLKPASLVQMLTPQFAAEGATSGFGIGFMIGRLEGKRRIGHGGAIYGFATELAALPDEKLGVVVAISCDCANAVATRIADEALRHMLAVKDEKPLPRIKETKSPTVEIARRMAGRYQCRDKWIDLSERNGKLWLFPKRGGFRVELRADGDHFVVDDRLEFGTSLVRDGDNLRIGDDVYARVEPRRPAPPPDRWRKLIGEYGWDHNTLYILEKDGQLHALIEWFFLYPLKEVSENVFEFPNFGLYHDEKLIFQTDKDGNVVMVNAANVAFPRRRLQGENGETFKVQPIRSIDELRREALTAKPPVEKGEFGTPDLVDLSTLDPSIKFDIRYATTNNFLNTPFYSSAKAYLQRPAAEALMRVHRKLAERGYGLLVFDGYRPWQVTKMFWDATPESLRIFVANPEHGSRHNRGCAVDLTLYDRKTGQAVEMVGGYDEMSDRSYPEYQGGTSRQRWHRELLKQAMEAEGFSVYEAEWWHFDYKDWKKYPIGNDTFEEIAAKAKPK